jgi:hypothetical protein
LRPFPDIDQQDAAIVDLRREFGPVRVLDFSLRGHDLFVPTGS